MAIVLSAIRDILLPGLKMTPEERTEAKAKSDAIYAKAAAP